MKIMFVNPPYTNFNGIKESAGHSIPLNIAYLAAYLREYTEDVIDILDAEALGLSYYGIEKIIESEKPDLIAITCPTPAVNHVIKIANIAKQINSGCFVIVGGPHPTAFPEQTAKIQNIDFVVIGEGEITLLELINTIRSRQENYKNVSGLAYELNDIVVVTSKRKLIENLDSLPFPARDLFDLKLYYSAPTKSVSDDNATAILTGRGCPHNCIHCMSISIWHRKYRGRSANNVVDEIEECVKKYNIKEFNFMDDTLTINKNRVLEICNEIKKRNLEISWICFARADTISKEILMAMKEAGCKKISFGLESGSQNILDSMRKKTTIYQARKAVKMVNDEGIKVHASFMFGNIGETKYTVKETIQFAKELKLDNATFFITTPYPGTDLYKIAIEKGHITKSTQWEDFAPITKKCPPLVQDNLTSDHLLNLQKKAFRDFYLRPSYVLYKLSRIRSLSEINTLLSGLKIFVGIQKR